MKERKNVDSTQQQVLEILNAIKKVQYGSVEIIIHGSQIVQVETREKIRFENRHSSK